MRRGDRSSSTSRVVLAGLGVALGLLHSAPAEARGGRWGHHRHGARQAHVRSGVPAAATGSAYAALVVDANTGRTLYADNENALRHPASITKVMTLYLLFEKLEKGEISLSTQIPVSRHAASQAPTKLGLRPGATISVENAIKAIVTRSANDMAVAVAEAVGGDEDSFAAMMTRKARALGMSRTIYVNASGLPDNRQITTARDLSILGRAVQDHYPTFYKFFSTTSFTYAGQVIANHNHLMSRVEGMDGIKTGYTNASGFNLLSNVRRDGHHIVAVVMGGRSAASRDRIMEGLIAENIEGAAPTRTAGVIQDHSTEEPAETVDVAARDVPDMPHDTSPSLIAPTMAVPPPPPVRPAATPIAKPRPAFVAGASRPAGGPGDDKRLASADGSTSGRVLAAVADQPTPSATPSSLRWVTGPQPAAKPKVTDRAPPLVRASADPERTASIRPTPPVRDIRVASREPEPVAGRGEWKIQIGAPDSPTAAAALLDRARSRGRTALGDARPLTERVQRGSATLYRARFAGLAPDQAEAACRTLKRSGFACFTTRD